jgi:polyphosphate glucokinase
VLDIIALLKTAMVCEYVLLGGGNAKLMKELPEGVIVGANSNAIAGGLKLWETAAPAAGSRKAVVTTTASKAAAGSKSVQ